MKLSPMMEHYRSLKEKHPDAILMYRLGDFFEMFFEDAIKASKILELTLTGRDCGLKEKAPMCGVPYHAVDNYIARLISSGNKVAICEQLTAPGDQKGLVKRDIVRIITPGTNTNDEMLDGTVNHYLCGVVRAKDSFATALLDITTGELTAKSFTGAQIFDLEDFLLTAAPREIIAPKEVCDLSKGLMSVISERMVKFTPYYDYAFDFDNAERSILKQLNIFSLDALGIDKQDIIRAVGGLLDYVLATQKKQLNHINSIKVLSDIQEMGLDYKTIKNLELLESQSDSKRVGSLIWVIDKTKTSMGARKLRNWVVHPLQNIADIEDRQTAIKELTKNLQMRSLLGSVLGKVKDIERLVTKISYGTIMPRDCMALGQSVRQFRLIKELINKAKSPLLHTLNANFVVATELAERIENTISSEPPATLKDGGFIKSNWDSELDQIRKMQKDTKSILLKFENDQKLITGIPSLKIGFNRIFGYYIEISKNKKPDILPEGYIRKQTVASGERYVNDELMNLEKEILGAADRILYLENQIYDELKDYLSTFVTVLQQNAEIIANFDCLLSLAEVAVKNNYVCPKFVKENIINIVDGRHPVVDELIGANEFVPNDTLINKDNTTMIITGPNMAGKSTYIRQVALIVLMAHLGSFVPANKVELCIVDKIFTRVGASDNLIRGQSTFMVEMLEVANILNNATPKSLLILDEIGRGTSTLDGLSIAWAIVEHISINIRAKTLFATHYHELSELEELLKGIQNYRILIQEKTDGITFLYKIARGGANKSFGIEVAAIAGVKKSVTDRAKEIMESLSESHQLSGGLKERLSENKKSKVIADQFSMFSENPKFVEISKILTDTDINRCTPVQALTILSDLKKIL